jgi:hypothetical protein
VQSVAASARFNANSGEHTIESAQPLAPLDVTIDGPIRTVTLKGTTLTFRQPMQNLEEMTELIHSIYFALPTLLNLGFADPPYVERVDGFVGSIAFRWELAKWRMSYDITTQDVQEQKVITAFDRLDLLSRESRRLFAGLHYFYMACRLSRAGCIAGEFVAEVVLNLAKCLQVLFPPGNRDAERSGLRSLGFSDLEIERDFLPADALRNEIDVAHVELGLFKLEQLEVIHSFTERAEDAFRVMFERLFSRAESGEFHVAHHELGGPRREAVALIERLKKNNSTQTTSKRT